MRRIKLTREEQEIEDNVENFVPVRGKKKKLLEAALAKARKEATISLRLSAQDLWEIKQKAQEEGLPYQTFIGSILHKYTTHQLIDEKALKRVVSALKTRR